MSKFGRKTKLVPSVVEDITSAMSIGATVEIACAYAGVSVATYYNWVNRGKEALEKYEADENVELSKFDEKCLRFYDDVEKSRSFAAIGWLQVVNEAAHSDPGYALKMLKIRHPEGYSEKQTIEVESDLLGQSIIDNFNRNLEKTYGSKED